MELEASEKLTGGKTLCRNSLAIFKILTAREDASIVSSVKYLQTLSFSPFNTQQRYLIQL
jgi:hypothetical protein